MNGLLSIGDDFAQHLRSWQHAAIDEFSTSADDGFLVEATPGAGKTIFACYAARNALDAGKADKVVVVCPTERLKHQWADASGMTRFGIHIDPRWTGDQGIAVGDFDGIAVTYQAVASSGTALVLRMMAERYRVFVILDEVHHAGDHRAWGASLREAFESAVAPRLLLSGTPFRTDGRPIPWVRYSATGDSLTSAPHYSYDYGRGLTDGIVAPIVFATYAGQMSWTSAGVQKTADLGDSLRSNDEGDAWRTALDPSGEWVRDLIVLANDRLTELRAIDPRAAGLILARDQRHAAELAAVLQSACGEAASVAVSDDPDSLGMIDRFTSGAERWIVAVKMVSEGVDIPRLSVLVYATNISAELFFRQAIGRVVRMSYDGKCAKVFLPAVPSLLALADRIKEEVRIAVDDQPDEADDGEPGSRQLELISTYAALGSGEAVHNGDRFNSENFTSEELIRAAALMRQHGVSVVVEPAQIASMLRDVTGAPPAAAPAAPTQVAAVPLHKQRDGLRGAINRKVFQLARAMAAPHEDAKDIVARIHGDLNRRAGIVGTSNATPIGGLTKKLQLVDAELARCTRRGAAQC